MPLFNNDALIQTFYKIKQVTFCSLRRLKRTGAPSLKLRDTFNLKLLQMYL